MMSHNISYFHEKVANYFILYLWTISYASGTVCIPCSNAVRLHCINLFKTSNSDNCMKIRYYIILSTDLAYSLKIIR